MELTYKTYATEITQLEGALRQMHFLISTDAVDRDGDVLDPKGWALENYRKNPIIPFAHDYRSLPVAKCVAITQTAKGLEATAEFPPKGVYPFADQVHDMLKAGFLNSTSVGFRPLDYEPATDRKGYNFKSQELTEWSIVPIPANPEALVQQRGVDVPEQTRQWCKALTDWAAQVDVRESPAKQRVAALYPADGPRPWRTNAQAWADLEHDYAVEAESGELPVARVAKLLALHGFTEEASTLTKMDQGGRDANLKQAHVAAMDAYANAHHAEAVMSELCGSGSKMLSGAHHGMATQAQGAIGRAKGHAMAAAELLAMGHGELPKDAREDLQKVLDREAVVTITKAPFELQTLILPKAHWKSQEEATAWVTSHGYAAEVDETGSSYRYRQADPGRFASLRTICFAPKDTPPGADCRIEAVGGQTKAVEERDAIVLRLRASDPDLIHIDDEDFTAAFTALGPELAASIAGSTTDAMNRLLGRLD